MGYRVDAIYDADALIRQIRQYCAAREIPEKLDEAALHAAWKAGRRETLALLVNSLAANGAFPAALARRLSEMPRETAAALFLHTLAVKGM